MGSSRNIRNRADENFAGVEIYGSESLRPDCIVEAKNAALRSSATAVTNLLQVEWSGFS